MRDGRRAGLAAYEAAAAADGRCGRMSAGLDCAAADLEAVELGSVVQDDDGAMPIVIGCTTLRVGLVRSAPHLHTAEPSTRGEVHGVRSRLQREAVLG